MKTEYIFDKDTYLDLQKRRIILCIVLAILGTAGVILFAFLYPLFDYNIYLIFEFVPTLAMGLIGLLYLGIILFMMMKLKGVEVRFAYEFKDEFLKAKSYSEGRLTSDNTVYYDRIIKYKETMRGFYLYLPNKKVLPLSSQDPQLDEIKKIIHIDDIPKKKI